MARRLHGFEVAVTPVASRARAGVRGVEELPGLLPDHDVVILTVPLTDRTRRLVDAAFLARMPDGALLVNVARGGVVDTDALLGEVRSGRLLAAVDVVDPEPLPAGPPVVGRTRLPDHPARRWCIQRVPPARGGAARRRRAAPGVRTAPEPPRRTGAVGG